MMVATSLGEAAFYSARMAYIDFELVDVSATIHQISATSDRELILTGADEQSRQSLTKPNRPAKPP